ncbi:fatty-acid amide hydrolase 2 isoform X2 [Lycorma delicatula]|uniref:fatty-acid amide hydrolase 2 isoform X2 n=1 Tax=Lycorma delicatula TaxID=130591 RepID=UPI003F516837
MTICPVHQTSLLLKRTSMFSPLIQYFIYYGLKLLKYVIIWPMTVIISVGPRKKCPPITNELLMLSASSLAHKIRTRQLTCVEVISAYIGRIRDVNPVLNAIVQDRFHDAMEEAHAVDALLANNTKSPEVIAAEMPLLGIPLTIKESIGVKGMSNNAARSNVKEYFATEDADVVRLLREAGAIVLLVSNTPELCLCWETFNNITGRTNNPFDVKRSPGGSSGGEAALLGAGASVIGMASDIGGSIRLPAMYTGVFGHKPTPGFVSNRGHIPTAGDTFWNKYFTLGPMCRFAEDLPLVLGTIIPDITKRKQLQLHESVDLRKIKLYYAEDEGPNSILTDKMSSEMKAAMKKAINVLQTKYGIIAKKVDIKGLEDSLALSALVMMRMKGIPNIFQKSESDPDQWKSVVLEILKRVTCNSSASLPSLLFGPLKAVADRVPNKKYKKMLMKKKEMMDQFRELLGSDGVFFYPSFPDPAHYHYQIFYKLLNASYLAIYNLLEMPVTACPLGLNSQGLPMGIQVVGWQCQDRLTIAVSQALEKEFGGWVPPLVD